MDSRTFTLEDQRRFASLSGDWNPLHTDPLTARRLLFGGPVVHGIHLLLWSLDRFSRTRTAPWSLGTIKAEFRAPLRLDEEARCGTIREDSGEIEIGVSGGSGRAARILFTLAQPAGGARVTPAPEAGRTPECRVLTFEEAVNASGDVAITLAPGAAGQLFPDLVRYLPADQIALLLATTRVVGMLCPGMHSLYSALDLTFSSRASEGQPMRYSVTAHDRRFSSLQIDVGGSGVTGTLKAFFRPPPREQAGFDHLRRLVTPGEFAGRQALIVGGSRGLGEVAAKILAAGGAGVSLTYRVGSADAERVAGEIVEGGGSATTRPFDVLAPKESPGDSPVPRPRPDILCYFAAPFISTAARGAFSSKAFREFCDYFVVGFVATVGAILGPEPRRLRVLYPSSVYVDETPPGMGEYAAAKAAGEVACRLLEKTTPGVTVHVRRFPRLATDQTAGLLPQPVADPIPVILETLRHLRDSG
ncbi:MAG TPA: SDR family NAD(P)-dependent oxidoreductase [Candidatus Cryosericum sp.]|nr:SDR family NAD(P)-dependent oxidoreductase [Candidatus Cryosericum sp.]